jgi:hypothetical protein
MSSESGPILDEYRFALKNMMDTRLLMELVTAHADLLEADDENRLALLDRYNGAKAEVLTRMDYEKGIKK